LHRLCTFRGDYEIVLRLAHGQHRAAGSGQHLFRYRSQSEAVEAAASVRPHHNQVDLIPACKGEDGIRQQHTFLHYQLGSHTAAAVVPRELPEALFRLLTCRVQAHIGRRKGAIRVKDLERLHDMLEEQLRLVLSLASE